MFWFFFSQKKIFKLFFVQQNNLEYVKQQNHLPNMTRNNSAVVTQLIRDQYEHLRTKMQKQLANQVLSIVGIRYYQENSGCWGCVVWSATTSESFSYY